MPGPSGNDFFLHKNRHLFCKLWKNITGKILKYRIWNLNRSSGFIVTAAPSMISNRKLSNIVICGSRFDQNCSIWRIFHIIIKRIIIWVLFFIFEIYKDLAIRRYLQIKSWQNFLHKNRSLFCKSWKNITGQILKYRTWNLNRHSRFIATAAPSMISKFFNITIVRSSSDNNRAIWRIFCRHIIIERIIVRVFFFFF